MSTNCEARLDTPGDHRGAGWGVVNDRNRYAEALWRQGAPKREAARQELLRTGTPVKWRISMALDAGGLYGPEVDVACGGEEPMVDEWEAGIRVPTAEQVVLLAALTSYPVEFFYEPVAEAEKSPMFMCGPRCKVEMSPPWGTEPPPAWFEDWATSAGQL